MTIYTDLIVKKYIKSVIDIDKHFNGYVDAYFGPSVFRQKTQEKQKPSLAEIEKIVVQLVTNVREYDNIDQQRKDFLIRQLDSVLTVLCVLQNRPISMVEEAEGFFDIKPQWIDEAIFINAKKKLNELLPNGNSLSERMVARNKSLEISLDKATILIPIILNEFRRRASKLFPLPENESFKVQFVSKQPWAAYNWFLGNSNSRIDINTDLPLQVNHLIDMMAHEGYPGHHTELSIKEKFLLKESEYLEHCLILINSPVNLVSEGLATRALQTIFTEEDLIEWETKVLFPKVSLKYIDVKREHAIDNIARDFAGILNNTVFLVHENQESDENVLSYLQEYGLRSEEEASQTLEFVKNPLFRSYMFTYYYGGVLIDKLLSAGNQTYWFNKLLTEPVTPSQIRKWISTEKLSS